MKKLTYTVLKWGQDPEGQSPFSVILQEVNTGSFEKAKEIYKQLESSSVLESVQIRINDQGVA